MNEIAVRSEHIELVGRIHAAPSPPDNQQDADNDRNQDHCEQCRGRNRPEERRVATIEDHLVVSVGTVAVVVANQRGGNADVVATIEPLLVRTAGAVGLLVDGEQDVEGYVRPVDRLKRLQIDGDLRVARLRQQIVGRRDLVLQVDLLRVGRVMIERYAELGKILW